VSKKIERCPACGHRKTGDRPEGPVTDTRNLIIAELAKETLTQEQRVELIMRLADLQVVATQDRRDKRDKVVRKIRIRKQQSVEEKAARRADRIIKRRKMRKPPEGGILSEDQVAKIRAKFPEAPIAPKPEQVTQEAEQEAVVQFFPSLKPKEEKPDAIE
jgi:hypothetical protein